MILWHILSQKRLEQKIKFATLNNGKLLLSVPSSGQDISNGTLEPYLYCLSHVVGGALFSTEEDLRVIKIQVAPTVRIFTHIGNPDDIPYPEISQSFDLIDMQITRSKEWPIRFRQILLLNSHVVENWSFEREIYETDFMKQFRELVENRIKSEYFFMSDFTTADQIAMASLIAHKLDLKLDKQITKEEAAARIEFALQRIGAH